MDKLESTYNRSIKIMFSLPWATHRNLLEPITETPHVRRILIHRYISFIKSIQKSKKKPLRNLLSLAKADVRTITGSNLRYIMLKSGKSNMDELFNSKVEIEYHKIKNEQMWRVGLVKEIIDALHDEKSVGLEASELKDILEFLCVE